MEEFSGWVFGVDLCDNRMRSAAIDGSGRVLYRTAPAGPAATTEAFREELSAQYDEVFGQVGTRPSGAGMAVPGAIEPGTSRMYTPAVWPGLEGLGLASELQALTRRDEVVVLRRANAALLGEVAYGAGRGATELLYLCLSSTVGGAVFSRGWLQFGLWGGAGEFGHLTVDPAGPQCRCGRTGCLEAMASGPAISAAAQEAAGRPGAEKLARVLAERSELTPAAVTAAAAAGDPAATEVLAAAGRAVAAAIVDLVNVFDPERVIVGGTVGEANPNWLTEASATVKARALEPARRHVALAPAHLGDESALVGLLAAIRAGWWPETTDPVR